MSITKKTSFVYFLQLKTDVSALLFEEAKSLTTMQERSITYNGSGVSMTLSYHVADCPPGTLILLR